MLSQMILQARGWLEGHQEGQGLVEYALIILLIAVVVIVVLVALGDQVKAVFQSIIDVFTAYPGT